MAKLKSTLTINDWQEFCREVYGQTDDRDFGVTDMLTNIQRFIMRGLKGIRKLDDEKTKFNIIIAMSWFVSLMNQLHLDLDQIVWHRFPYLCSYCGKKPCVCKDSKIKNRQKIRIVPKLKPKNLSEYQTMFQAVYPMESRSLENAGIHLAEEMGELSEAILTYRGTHTKSDFEKVTLEAADLFSCCNGVFNSLEADIAKEVSKMFSDNCYRCHQAPCECSFNYIMGYKS